MASALAAIDVAIIRHPIILPSTMSTDAAIAQLTSSNRETPRTAAHHNPCIAHAIADHERSRYLCVAAHEQIIGIVSTQDLMATLIQASPRHEQTLQDLLLPIAATRYEADLNTLAALSVLHQEMQQQNVDLVLVLNSQDQPIGLISDTSLLCAIHMQTLPSCQMDQLGAIGQRFSEVNDVESRERPLAEQIIRWKEHAVRYRALFEDAYDAILIANLDGDIIEVNHQAEVLFGYSRSELLSMHQSALHPPEDSEQVVQQFQATFHNKQHTGTNLRILCKDGKIKYTDIRAKMILVDNTPIIQGIFHDITQRKQTEDALKLLIEGTEAKHGQAFFISLVEAIAAALSVDRVVVTELISGQLKTLAIYSDEIIQTNVRYNLKGTPCQTVLKIGHFSCASDFQHYFSQLVETTFKSDLSNSKLTPNFESTSVSLTPVLGENTASTSTSNLVTPFKADAQSYVGVALFGQTGKAIGHLFIQDKYEISDVQHTLSILSIFAARAAIEIERQWSYKKLKKLNKDLQFRLKQQALELLEKEHFLQTLLDLDAFPLSVFWKDTNSIYLGCNRAFLRDANLTKIDDIIGKSDYEMPWAETEAENYRADDHEVIESNQAKLGIIETQVQADGHQVWLETNKIPFYDLDGQVRGVVGIYQNITERRRTEAELQHMSMRLNLAVRSANIGIWDWDVVNDVLIWDEQMFALYGIESPKDHNVYQTWLTCVHPEDAKRASQAIMQALAGEKDYDIEFRIVRPDGQVYFLQANAIVQHDSKHQPIRMIGTNYDITERKHTEELLRQAKEAAELANRAKSNFLALMSHEIRTPINGVLGLAHLIHQTQLDSTQQEYLHQLENSASSLSKIVNDILDFSKIEADKLSLESIEFELDEILERLQAVLALKANEKHLDLQFEVGDTVPRRLVGDPLRLGQVAINLVNNAIKFTDRGRVTVSINECDRDPGAHTTTLQFSVHDTGIGLTSEQIEILFQPFTQVDPSTSRRQNGTGLGLTICQQLITLMGGAIEVQSELGCGSTFCFKLTLSYYESGDHAQMPTMNLNRFPKSHEQDETLNSKSDDGSVPNLSPDLNYTLSPTLKLTRPLPETNFTQPKVIESSALDSAIVQPNIPTYLSTHPLKLSPQTYPLNQAPQYNSHPPQLPEALVLVVEDNDVNQLVARKVLEQFGLSVELAVNGRQAIAQVLHRRYDLILMDIRMPEIDGLEATRRIRRLSQLGTQQTQYLKTVPIIAMTAHAFESDRQRSLDAGMNDHLNKPINPEILYATLTHWLKVDYEPLPPRSPVTSRLSHSATTTSIAHTASTANTTSTDNTTSNANTAKITSTTLSSASSTIPLELSSTMPSFPGLNVSEGLGRVYGDSPLYCELLQLFVEIYQPFSSNLATAFQHHDYEQIILLIHTLKGAAANVAATAVVKQAEQVLQQLRGKPSGSVMIRFESTAISLLLRSLEEVLVSIEQAIKTIEMTDLISSDSFKRDSQEYRD